MGSEESQQPKPLLQERKVLCFFQAANRSSVTCLFLTTTNITCPADAQGLLNMILGDHGGEDTFPRGHLLRPALGGDLSPWHSCQDLGF